MSSTEAWCLENGGSPIYNRITKKYQGCSGTVQKPLPIETVDGRPTSLPTVAAASAEYLSAAEAEQLAQQGKLVRDPTTGDLIDAETGLRVRFTKGILQGSAPLYLAIGGAVLLFGVILFKRKKEIK